MDIFQSSYYIRCNRYLSFCGHWPYQSLRNRIRNFVLLMFLMSTILIPQIIKFWQLRHNIHVFVAALPSMLYYCAFLFKNSFSMLQSKEIKKVLEKIKSDFQRYKDEDLKILHKYSGQANKINTFYTVYMFMAVGGYSMLPLTLHVMDIALPKNESRLPTKPRLINYNIEAFDENIFFIIIHGVIVDTAVIVFIIGFETLCFSFSYHVCALFVIVTNKIRDSIDERITSKHSEVDQDIFYRNFVKIVIMHKDALDFVDTVETALSVLNLFAIGFAMMPLTITGFEFILSKGNVGEMARWSLFAFGEIVHLFYYNWPGQKIRDHSLCVYQSCYAIEWYKEEIPDKCKKLLNLMMLRGQKPCSLTAGKVYILGLENFAAVMKVSMSYFTVLSSVM
ncbi:odorant receptor 191 [Nasonia vitripennis]|uniref:Odorant receptor n=1 Tax=Nasonia vitripennis TaxID=7425 RepID=A0A7M6UGC2_NASVI|nr:odorant receptor 191 [Nasonia vitripennis]